MHFCPKTKALTRVVSILPDGENFVVDLVELGDEGAGGGQVKEPGHLVIHIRHLGKGQPQQH